MKTTNKKKQNQTLAMGAILTAIVIVLQVASPFIPHLGPCVVSLVLIPVIVGAAMCNSYTSAWLGFVFGLVVLLSGQAEPFPAINFIGTVITVLCKGTLCGLAAGLIYKALSKVNQYLAVVIAAVVTPIVNTGVFLIGCRLFFFDTVSQWGVDNGFDNPVKYMFISLAAANFIFEFVSSIIACPIIVRILRIKIK